MNKQIAPRCEQAAAIKEIQQSKTPDIGRSEPLIC
jgi:hypothetical protein